MPNSKLHIKFLLAIAFLISMLGISYGQAGSVQPTATSTNMTSKYYKYLGYVGIDSGLFIPSRDTVFTPISGKPALTRRNQDQNIYYYDSTLNKWVVLGSSLNSFLNGGNSFGGSASIGTNDSNYVFIRTKGINRWSISPFDGRLTYGATSLRGDDYGSITTGQAYLKRISATDYISFPPDTIAHSGYSNVISFQNGLPYYNTGGVWHSFLNDSTSLYSAGFGLILNSYQFKVDTSNILPKNDSGYLYTTPTQLSKKLNNSNFIDSLNGRNATLLGNTTTGSGSTIVLSGSPTLTLPNIAAVNVSGGILSFPTGASGTVALRGDTTARYTGFATLGKTYNDSLVLNRTAGIDVTITKNAVNADTTTGATKLATQGYVGRNFPTGTLSGNGTPSGQLMPFSLWSSTNGKLSSSTVTYGNYDSVNNNFNFGTTTPQSSYLLNASGNINGNSYYSTGSLLLTSSGGNTFLYSAGNGINLVSSNGYGTYNISNVNASPNGGLHTENSYFINTGGTGHLVKQTITLNGTSSATIYQHLLSPSINNTSSGTLTLYGYSNNVGNNAFNTSSGSTLIGTLTSDGVSNHKLQINGYSTATGYIVNSSDSLHYLRGDGSVALLPIGGSVTSVSTTSGLGITSSVGTATTTPNISISVDTSSASILSRQRAASTYAGLSSVNTFTTTNYFKGLYAAKDSLPTVTGKMWGLIVDTATNQIGRQLLLNYSSLVSGQVTFANGSSSVSSNSNLFWDNTNNYLGLMTNIPTHTLTLANTATGQTFYSTSDQTTNYSRVTLKNNGNFSINPEQGGSGSYPNVYIGRSGFVFGVYSGDLSYGDANYYRSTSTSNTSLFGVGGVLLNSSGYSSGSVIDVQINQSGTASSRQLWISANYQAVGSGVNYLIDAGTNTQGLVAGTHTSKFTVDTTGNTIGATFNATAAQTTINSSTSGSTVTSGSAVFSEPLAGSSLRMIMIYCNSLIGGAVYTFPKAFTNTPTVLSSNGLATSLVTSISTTAVTVTGATSTGVLVLIGY